MPNNDPSLSVFLCYAQELHSVAEGIHQTLVNSGHNVFIDRRSITTASEHHAAISAAIALSDIAVYLISPKSVADGAYTLTELGLMRDKWPSAVDRIISVLPQGSTVTMDQVPVYAKSVSVLRIDGDLVAEVAKQVRQLAIKWRPKYRLDADEMKAIEAAFTLLDKEWEKDQVGDTVNDLGGIGCVTVSLIGVIYLVSYHISDITNPWTYLILGGIAVTGLIVISKLVTSLQRDRRARRKYRLRREALRKRYDDWLHNNIGE
jgi:DNA gyrase inhibitor GyrI